MDVKNGFWHINLDESTYLTTFQTPFYRWLQTPFVISSAPVVFQRCMHETIEGLHRIEVVADDFIAVGYGDHDKNLLAFQERCQEQNVGLNSDKPRIRQRKILFIDHMATDKGLKVHPSMVRTIVEIRLPTDKQGVLRLLYIAQ